MPNKLLFILAYQKGYELQTFLALHFGISQPQANYWIHRLLPLLQQALSQLQYTLERDPAKVLACSSLRTRLLISLLMEPSGGANVPKTPPGKKKTAAVKKSPYSQEFAPDAQNHPAHRLLGTAPLWQNA